MAEQWFRRTRWGPRIAEDFDRRLQRAQPAKRAQALRIQAVTLQDTGETENVQVALGLLDRLLAEHSNVTFQLAQAHLERAECLAALGRGREAVEAAGAALDAQQKHRGVETIAPILFGELVLANKMPKLYPRALKALSTLGDDWPFPIAVFRAEAVRAQIAARQKKGAKARLHATKALEQVHEEYSGFWKHPELGLVHEEDESAAKTITALLKLAPMPDPPAEKQELSEQTPSRRRTRASKRGR